MRLQFRSMSSAYRAEASLVICELAAGLDAFRAAACIACFFPLPSEPDVRPLIEEAWAQRKQVVLPRLRQEGVVPCLEWHAVTGWQEVIEPGPFGLREPDPARCPLVHTRNVDLVFVPGLAFDERGLRLGRGGGFYDRFLSQAPTELARFGLMFTCQRLPRLPCEPHDQKLPAVLTEDGLTWSSSED